MNSLRRLEHMHAHLTLQLVTLKPNFPSIVAWRAILMSMDARRTMLDGILLPYPHGMSIVFGLGKVGSID